MSRRTTNRERSSGDSPPTLALGRIVLAVALGAGAPLLWAWFAASDEPPAAAAVETQAVVKVAAAEPVAPREPAVPSEPNAAPSIAPASPAAIAVPAVAPQIPRMRDPQGDQSPDIADFINPGEVPTMAEVISRLHAAGVRSGLGAFNPPGTRPPLVGLAVSEDFELPPGYVRHHQVTDDGQRIEPILMFAPDHPRVVAAGAAQPQDRVVPPELAPDGLPLRHIVVPAPLEPGKQPR